jgi:hypothetical protein
MVGLLERFSCGVYYLTRARARPLSRAILDGQIFTYDIATSAGAKRGLRLLLLSNCMYLRNSLDTAQALLKVNHPAASCGVSMAHDVNNSDSVTAECFYRGSRSGFAWIPA